MIKKIFKNALSIFISINLITMPSFATTNQPETEERTLEIIDTFLRNSSPSDIPFIDFRESFSKDSTQPLKRFDLTDYEGKKIFVGYGIYDKNQNFCKYVEKPGMEDPKLYLENFSTYNKHSYAISMTTMNYNSCVNLANQFNGVPVVISSQSENGFISSKYNGISKWIGLERQSCEEEYINKDGLTQSYFNWSSVSETGNDCSESKLNVIQNNYGTWNKKDALELNRCLIEVDSEDINRPIKICAPWWRIEREYQKESESIFGGVDIYKINQADIPEQFNVCTKYEESAIEETLDAPNRKVTCTNYYDSMIAPECLTDPYQDICFVDECNGYIKNACNLIDTVSGYKNYTKAEGIINHSNQIIKGKVDIKTQIYECPPSLPSLSSCEEQSTVIIFPQECPGSDCEGYKTCIQNATTIEEKNNCSVSNVCEKIYGNPDNIEFNTDGSLKFLKNTCSDGTVLYFEPSIQNRQIKKCLEYEYYTIEEEVSQRCTLDRPYTDHIVDTSITEEDIYMNNPNCIRLNNVSDAIPNIQVTFNYTNYGWAQTIIKKSYLDGEQQINIQEGSDEDIVNAAMNSSNVLDIINNISNPESTEISFRDTDCSNYNEDWHLRNENILNKHIIFNEGLPTEIKYIANSIVSETTNTIFAKYLMIPSLNICNDIKNAISGTSTSYDTVSKICKVYINPLNGDSFSLIKGNGTLQEYPTESVQTFTNILNEEDCISLKLSNGGNSHYYIPADNTCEIYTTDNNNVFTAYGDYTYITKNQISKSDCDDIAYCLDGTFNESAYISSELSQCQVSAGENFTYPYEEEATLEAMSYPGSNDLRDENCVPFPKEGGYISQINGLQDVYSIQEIVDGEFGYFSNYNSHPYKNNIITVNEKEVYPIKPIPVLDDPLIYEGDFTQYSITTKSPNFVAGAIGGTAAASTAFIDSFLLTMTSTGIGVLVVVVFVLFTMIFGKKQKLNEQEYSWVIYKLVPTERYIPNIYGYDKRTLQLNEDGSVYITTNDEFKLIYAEIYGFTGTLKPADFRVALNNLFVQKQILLTCMGWFLSDVDNITHPVEKDVIVDYPSCKRLSFKCNKKNSGVFNHDRDPFFKRMTNNYIGATNGVSIVVPYLGDYELIAYDKYDNVLSTIIIYEEEFIESLNNVAKFAQVMFGLNMDLADEINEGNQNNACRYDLMVEWGGGISGIYYENNNTGQNQDCQKSQDNYVKETSATKIKIRSLALDRHHVIELEKPLPFANRVFLVTLNEKEVREYRCYDEFGNCDTDNYNTIENN